jgi:hypothetical protein
VSNYASPNKPPQEVQVRVICINDKGRPNEIPLGKWPVKGKPYTITGFVRMLGTSGGGLGVTLAEMSLEGCYPYKYYMASRFGVPVGDTSLVERAEELLKEAKEEELVLVDCNERL